MSTRPPPPSAQALLEMSFHLDSITPIADPNGTSASWFRYVISQGPNGDNPIVGTKSGSHSEVSIQLNQMVERLNERFGKLQAKQQRR